MILFLSWKSSFHILFVLKTVLLSVQFTALLAFSTQSPSTHTIAFKNPKENHAAIDIPWLIVGGGIHGVHIATRLLGNGGISPANVCIIDENESLLQKWKSRTAATGMEYLRSSAGYHLDLDEHSLRCHFRQVSGGKKQKRKSQSSLLGKKNQQIFTRDYERPRLDIFNQHCDSVVEKYGLDELHTQGVVKKIEPTDDYVRVLVSLPGSDEANEIVYKAKNVVLALGNDDPTYADWVDEDDLNNGLVEHLFDQKHAKTQTKDHVKSQNKNHDHISDVAVIGAGISGAHKILELVRAKQNANASKSVSPGSIHLISRHPLREQQFDTHQDWMMDRAASKRSEEAGGAGIPKRQRKFLSTSWKDRRLTIAKERIPGTITPAIHRGNHGLCYAIDNGDVQWHQAEVLKKIIINGENNHSRDKIDENDSTRTNRTRIELSLSCGDIIKVDKVLLATGFGKKRPGGKLIQDLIEMADLEVSGFCGYPICDAHLLWHPKIFVAGALAELELGPSARNIAGARLAAERILQAIEATKL